MKKYTFMEAVELMKNGHALTNTYQSYRGEDNERHFVIENGALIFRNGNKYSHKNLQVSELTNECWHDFDLASIKVDKRVEMCYCVASKETQEALEKAGYPNFIQGASGGDRFFVVEDVYHVWKSDNEPDSFEPMFLDDSGEWVFGNLRAS